MNPKPPCPICGSTNLIDIGAKSFTKTAIAEESDYVRPRLDVLFECWHPQNDTVLLTYHVCAECGFIFYTPRPDEMDLSAKYAYFRDRQIGAHSNLANLVNNSTATSRGTSECYPAHDDRRTRQLRRDLRKVARTAVALRVLDFGGGDGRLMRGLVRDGHECYLLDYSTQIAPGVTKIGQTIEDLHANETFDIIICNQVIEHLAEPRVLLGALARHLVPSGVIYIEVPMEVWGGPPIQVEPVTHVNFFTPASMSRLIFECGLLQLSCRLSSSPAPRSRAELAIKALARLNHGDTRTEPPKRGLEETRALLSPGLRERWWRFSAAPGQLAGALSHRLGLQRISEKWNNLKVGTL